MGAPRVSQVLHGFPLRALLLLRVPDHGARLVSSGRLTGSHLRTLPTLSAGVLGWFLVHAGTLGGGVGSAFFFRTAVQGDIALAVAL